MTKSLQELQVKHSELCARAADRGVAVPEDLTVDFDTEETGRTVIASLEKLVGVAGVAEAPEVEQDATMAKPKKAKKSKAAAPAPAEQQETDMTATAKKASTKSKAKKAAKKKVVKKAAAKKGAAKKAKVARGDSKTSKVIAKMKNGGITRAEVLKMTGWKAVSMQQLATNAGVKLSVSDERPFTYRAK